MVAQAPPRTPSPPQAPPGIDPALNNYLQQFSSWASKGFATALSSNQALPGVLLQAYDAPPGTIPNVFMIQVNSAGEIVATPIPLGGGKP
jgi:hypothetical protein